MISLSTNLHMFCIPRSQYVVYQCMTVEPRGDHELIAVENTRTEAER